MIGRLTGVGERAERYPILLKLLQWQPAIDQVASRGCWDGALQLCRYAEDCRRWLQERNRRTDWKEPLGYDTDGGQQ